MMKVSCMIFEIVIAAGRSMRRSGVSAERRILRENESSGFLPKAATFVLRKF
jgi:hypothetical protein